MMYFSVDATYLIRLDKFEGAYYVCKEKSIVMDNGQACRANVYVLNEAYRNIVLDKAWDPALFELDGIYAFLAGYQGFKQLHL